MDLRQHLVYWMVGRFYNYLSSRDRHGKLTFMNFGFASAESEINSTHAGAPDPEVRRKALYWTVANSIGANGWDWRQKDVLEVGSGRGGGADYLMARLKPRSYRGIDLSARAIKFCQDRHSHPGLTFSQGNAEALEFPGRSFDVVINLESSHCYPRMLKFLQEVDRVLRPRGYLLLADFRRRVGVASLHRYLQNSGLVEISRQDITENVLAALRLDSAANLALIQQYVPWWLHWLFRPFAGVENSGMPESFASGERVYLSFVYQKPA
ncbi:MAG TPA: class I SAM-dependent methyltransferase [Dehalococcoidia bacterium]|nr:class I SAM-dependent methyltransferase [Dehalococcoidia bacterium]